MWKIFLQEKYFCRVTYWAHSLRCSKNLISGLADNLLKKMQMNFLCFYFKASFGQKWKSFKTTGWGGHQTTASSGYHLYGSLSRSLSLFLAVHSEDVTALRLDFAQGFVSRSAASSHAFCISSLPASVHNSHRSLQQILARSSFYGDFFFVVFWVSFSFHRLLPGRLEVWLKCVRLVVCSLGLSLGAPVSNANSVSLIGFPGSEKTFLLSFHSAFVLH